MNSVTLASLLLAAASTCCLFVGGANAAASPPPTISANDSSTDITADAGPNVSLTCAVLPTAKAQWYFTDQHLHVASYAGDSATPILLSTGHAYSVLPLAQLNLTQAGSGNETAVTTSYAALTIRFPLSEQTYGHYQCQATPSAGGDTAVHNVYVRMNSAVELPVADRSAFSSCCQKQSLPANCQPFCQPWNLSLTDEIQSRISGCLPKITDMFASCGVVSKHPARCCALRGVPAACLPACHQPLHHVDPGCAAAENASAVFEDIFTCHAESLVTVPGPPIDISATLDSENRRISVRWREPTANPSLVRGYSVHWKANSDVLYFSQIRMSILSVADVSLPPSGPLAPHYYVYVQSIGLHGTSVASAIVTTVVPPVAPNATLTPVMKCCLEDKNMTAMCADRLCAGKPILDVQTLVNSSCGRHISDVFACYAGGRNHTACCADQSVPLTACGKFCTGELPHITLTDTAACLPHLDAISRCYDEGAKGIPSPPRRLSLDGITDRSVSVRWLAPLYNAHLVRNYSLLVTDKITGWRSVLVTSDTAYTVSGLASDRFYELAVAAVGAEGSSLPSNAMTVMTMDTPPDSARPPANSGQPDMPACCAALSVPANCSATHCASPAAFRPSDMPSFCRSSAVLPAMLACLTDGRNNSACCAARSIPTSCLSVCAARPGDAPPAAHCFVPDVLAIAATCAQAAYAAVPSEPSHLRVQSYGTNFVDLAWQLPARRPVGVNYRYSLLADVSVGGSVTNGVLLTHFPSDVTVGHVVSLRPGGQYTFRMTATVDDGRASLPSDPVTVWLLPDLPSNWSASSNTSHLPYGISQCCQAKKVPLHCQLLCDPRNMTNWNHTDSSLQSVYTNCTPSLPDISHCLADGKNHESCCLRESVPTACLGLCSGARVPGDSLVCPLWWREIYGCIEEGIISVPPGPIIHRVDVYSNRLSVTFDRNLISPAGVRTILYIRYADSPSHWYAFLDPASPATFRVAANTSFSVFMLNSNVNGSSQPTPVYTVRTHPQHPLGMYITSSMGSFRINESATDLALNCYFTWPYPVTPTYLWYQAGLLLQSGADSSLVIRHPEARHSGRYTCALRLSSGQAGSVSADLHVQSAITASAFTDRVAARQGSGQTARLTCAFEGFPDRVDWRGPDGVPLADTRDGAVVVRLPIISDLLTYSTVDFTGISASQFGHYTCTGVNSFGQRTAGLWLYNADDASGTTPAPPTVGPAPTADTGGGGSGSTSDGSASASCCANRGVQPACLGICAATAAAQDAATGLNVSACVAANFAQHASHCLAGDHNVTRCCQAASVPAACLPLCWGDPPLPADTACPASAIATCLRSPGVPGRPRAVQAGPVSPHSLRVTWQPPMSGTGDVTGYRIVLRVGSAGHVIEATVGRAAVSFLQSSVPSSSAVTVTVIALGNPAVGESQPSLPASAATPGPPATPTQLHLSMAGNNVAVVAWDVLPGGTTPDGFQVNVTLLGGRTMSLRVASNQHQATLRCLLPRSTYHIRVSALSSAWGNSDFTQPPLRLATTSEDATCRDASYDFWLTGAATGDRQATGAGTAVLVIILLLALLALAFTGLLFYWRRTGVPSGVRSRLPCVLDIVEGDCCRCCDPHHRGAGYVANSNGGGGGGGGRRGGGADDQLFDNPVRFDNADGVVRFGAGVSEA